MSNRIKNHFTNIKKYKMKQIKTLKQLKEDYWITFDSKCVLLYTKEPDRSSRMVHKYLCQLDRTNSGFLLAGVKIKDRSHLLEQVNLYINGLEFDSEYYYPRWRKECFCHFVIIDWLSKIGFKYNGSGWDKTESFFSLIKKGIYGNTIVSDKLSIRGLDSLDKEVECILHFSDSWIKIKCLRQPKEIMKAVSSLLKPYCLDISVSRLLISDDLEQNISKNRMLLEQIKGFDVASQKVQLKEKLLELANQL